MTRFFGALLHFVFRFSTLCLLKWTRFFGALRHFGFACPQFVFSKWLDFLVRCCTSYFASPQFIIWKWLDILVRCCTSVSLVHNLFFQNDLIFWCVAALRIRFSTVYHLKMTRFFGALLHFVFRFSKVCHLKVTRSFGALLHFGFACPQFVFSKWLDFLVRCCTSVSLFHSLSFEND